jgi:hypothetical protein
LENAWENGTNVNMGEFKGNSRILWDKYMEIIEELKPLAVKYKTTLEGIGEKAKSKAEVWKNKSKTIGQDWWEEVKQIIPFIW